MNASHRHLIVLAAALVVLPVSLAWADASQSSSLALPTAALELSGAPVFAVPSADLAIFHTPVPDVQLGGVHYRPSSGGRGRHLDSQSATQIHMGFFDPEGGSGQQFMGGIRGGPMLDPHVQLGVGVDWAHVTDNVSTSVHQSLFPNGIPITTQTNLSRYSSDLFPIIGFVQVNGDDKMRVIPFIGIGGGYEWMNLTADNYVTGASFDATYGGWGWQAWVGAAIPLSGRTRLSGEAFMNIAELDRDVYDSALGGSYHETVSADGAGMRFGIAWGF